MVVMLENRNYNLVFELISINTEIVSGELADLIFPSELWAHTTWPVKKEVFVQLSESRKKNPFETSWTSLET